MEWMRTSAFLLVMFGVQACGSALPEPEPQHSERSADRLETGHKADIFDAPRRRLDVADALTATWVRNRLVWSIAAEVAGEPEAIRASLRDAHYVDLVRGDAGAFEVVLDNREAVRLAAGEPLLVVVEESGHTWSAAVTFAVRFIDVRGTSRLILEPEIQPVLAGSQLLFRGRATAADGHELAGIFTDDDAAPLLARTVDGWRFDWSPELLTLAADIPQSPVYFEVNDGADGWFRLLAAIEIGVRDVQTIDGGDNNTWRRSCEPSVRECLEGLDGHFDTADCGAADEVLACVGEGFPIPDLPTPSAFVDDLRSAVTELYERAGAPHDHAYPRTREEAMSAIDPALVQVWHPGMGWIDLDTDPHHLTIYRHPDPLGESHVSWYGAYEASGRLWSLWSED